MDFKDCSSVCQKLLQHCCEMLQASCGVVSIIHEGSKKIEPLYYYDKKNLPIDFILSNFYWEDIAPYFTEDGFSLCTDLNNVPNCNMYSKCENTLRSGITKTIVIKGQRKYLLTPSLILFTNRTTVI